MSDFKEKKLISIVMPTHNRPIMMRRAIESIFNQEYCNWELIIIADSCKEDTRYVVNDFLKDKRVQFFEYEKLGGAEARNIGINISHGEYICFLDDDDEWLPGKLILQTQFLNDNPDFSIVSCNNFHIVNNKSYALETRYGLLDFEDMLYENIIGSFSFTMVRKEDIKDFRIHKDLKSCQDWDLWLKILYKSKKKAFILREKLVNYYAHEENRLSNNLKNKYKSYLLFNRIYWESYNKRQKLFHLNILKNYKIMLNKENNFSYLIRLIFKRVMIFIYIGNFKVILFYKIVFFPMKKLKLFKNIELIYYKIKS